MIKFDKLFAVLQEKHLNPILLSNSGIEPIDIEKMKSNLHVDTKVIDRICEVLNCQPGDIMEYEK